MPQAPWLELETCIPPRLQAAGLRSNTSRRALLRRRPQPVAGRLLCPHLGVLLPTGWNRRSRCSGHRGEVFSKSTTGPGVRGHKWLQNRPMAVPSDPRVAARLAISLAVLLATTLLLRSPEDFISACGTWRPLRTAEEASPEPEALSRRRHGEGGSPLTWSLPRWGLESHSSGGARLKITRVYISARFPDILSLLLVGKYLQVPTPVSLWGGCESNKNNQVLFFL